MVRWQVSNDRASVDRFIAEVELESARLQSQIDATRARVQQARGAAARRADAQADFAALFLAAQDELAKIEREHSEILDAVGAAATEEAARLLADARDTAAAVRAASVLAEMSAFGEGVEPMVAGVDSPATRSAGDWPDDR